MTIARQSDKGPYCAELCIKSFFLLCLDCKLLIKTNELMIIEVHINYINVI